MTTPYKHLVGKPLTEGVRAELIADSAKYRIIRPGYMVTMDYQPTRINIHVNEDNIITSVDQG